MNLNKAFIIGNLTRDPETRALPSGQSVVSFGVATNRIWKDASGEKKQATEFHNVVAFGKLADICSQYLTKGKMVFIEGRIQTRTWQGGDGQKRSRTEIVAETMQMGPRGMQSSQPQETREVNTKKEEPPLDTVEYPPDEETNPEANPDEMPF